MRTPSLTSSRSLLRPVSAAAVLFLCNCAAPPANGGAAGQPGSDVTTPVTVTVERATYAPGSEVTLRIANRSDQRFGYNACTRTVERESGASWVMVPEPDRVCTMELRILEARSTVTARTELPRSLDQGRYRLLLSLLREPDAPAAPGGQPDRLTVASNPFRVE